MIETIKSWDESLFLLLNGMHSSFFDWLMFWASDRFIWIPLYTFGFFYLLLNYKLKGAVWVIFIIPLIFMSDTVSSGIIKDAVERLRPCHNAALRGAIHLVGNCGGEFGFISSHAANSFALATYLGVVLKEDSRRLIFIFWLWAGLISYSRIYLGVHYPLDVLGGMILGIVLGYLTARAAGHFTRRIS